jgi:hypothetical protein
MLISAIVFNNILLFIKLPITINTVNWCIKIYHKTGFPYKVPLIHLFFELAHRLLFTGPAFGELSTFHPMPIVDKNSLLPMLIDFYKMAVYQHLKKTGEPENSCGHFITQKSGIP